MFTLNYFSRYIVTQFYEKYFEIIMFCLTTKNSFPGVYVFDCQNHESNVIDI